MITTGNRPHRRPCKYPIGESGYNKVFRALVKYRGETLSVLAKKFLTTEATLSRLYNGKTLLPNATLWAHISEYFSIPYTSGITGTVNLSSPNLKSLNPFSEAQTGGFVLPEIFCTGAGGRVNLVTGHLETIKSSVINGKPGMMVLNHYLVNELGFDPDYLTIKNAPISAVISYELIKFMCRYGLIKKYLSSGYKTVIDKNLKASYNEQFDYSLNSMHLIKGMIDISKDISMNSNYSYDDKDTETTIVCESSLYTSELVGGYDEMIHLIFNQQRILYILALSHVPSYTAMDCKFISTGKHTAMGIFTPGRAA